MAVIITDMAMPKGCWGCKWMRTKDPETNYCMLSDSEFDDRLDLLTSRQKDCPLKSVDEMIAEIEKAKNFWGKYKRTSLAIEMEEIIHKYCDKEKQEMFCESCKHWKPTRAPFVKHGIPLVMTCEYKDKGKLEFRGGCKYWEKRDEPDNKRED